MADGRKNNGGARKGAGRKPKAEELKLIEKLTPLESEAFKQLEKGLKQGNYAHLKLFFEYLYGKPNTVVTVDGGLQIETPSGFTFNINTNKD